MSEPKSFADNGGMLLGLTSDLVEVLRAKNIFLLHSLDLL